MADRRTPEGIPCHWGHTPYCEHQDPIVRKALGIVEPPGTPDTCINCEHPVRLHGGSTGCSSLYDGGASTRCGCGWHEDNPVDITSNAYREGLGDLNAFKDTPASEKQVAGNHYTKFRIQPWAVIDEYGLGFYAGNALKYLLRAGHKGVAVEDLRKARHYLDRMIEIEEAKEG